MDPQEPSPLSWDEAVEFGGVEVIVALVVVVVVFIIIVLFGPLDSVLRLVSCRPPFPLLLLPNTLLLAVPLFTSVSSIILLLSGAAMLPQPSKGPCWGAMPILEPIPEACGSRWPWDAGLGVEFWGQAPWLAFGFKVFGFNPPLMQGELLPVVVMLLTDCVPHTPLLLMSLLLWLPMLLLPILLEPATEKWEEPVMLLFPLFAPAMVPIPPPIICRPVPSPFTEAPTIMAEVTEEEGEEAVEDTEEEAFADIIIAVVTATAAWFFSEPIEELESASMHSVANSGSDPDPQPEEEEEEQENEEEEGGQTEELVEEGLLGLSVLPSTRTLPQLLLLSPLQGEPEDQGEGSYCESRPGCSRPEESMTRQCEHGGS